MMDNKDKEDEFDRSLESAAMSMPQFDVPEKLTQNIMAAIMAAVQAEQVQKSSGLRTSTMTTIAALAAAMLIWNSFDSSAGWLSWCISVAVLWTFKVLFESGDSQEPLAQ
jgi:hypothetical protein